MPVVYALVARARDGEALAEHAVVSAAKGLAVLAVECWRTYKDAPSEDYDDDDFLSGCTEERFAVMCDNLSFTVLARGGFVFVVVADEATAARGIPSVCAQRISDAWMERLGEVGLHARPAVLQRAFGPVLKKELAYCDSHAGEMSRQAMVQSKVDEVKGILIANVESVVRSLEKMEGAAQDKAHVPAECHVEIADEKAAFNADKLAFQQQGERARERVRAGCGLKLCVIVVALLITALVIGSAVCFGTGAGCLGGGGGRRDAAALAPQMPPAMPQLQPRAPDAPADASAAAPSVYSGGSPVSMGGLDLGGILRMPRRLSPGGP